MTAPAWSPAWALLTGAALLVAAAPAHADEAVDRGAEAAGNATARARVIALESPVYSGPDRTYRTVYLARRDQVFEVLARSTQGYFFEVMLDDGTTGWIDGEAVFPVDGGRTRNGGFFARTWAALRDGLLAPPPITTASVEISFSAGMLANEGLFLLRPAWIIDPAFALEAFAGLSPRAEKDVFLAGVGGTLRLAAGARIAPFAYAGLGAAHFRPKADNFVDPEETLMAVNAGGGLEITFKRQITLRLDARSWLFFDPDKAFTGTELSAGLAIYF